MKTLNKTIIMKPISRILILTTLCSLLFISCSLEEEPPFLSEKSVFGTANGAEAALNGVYSSFAGFNYYGADFHHLTLFTSGLFTSGKGPDRANIAALAPTSSQNYPTGLWKQSYSAIARTNDLISNISDEIDEEQYQSILGQAYFLRAHTYFNLVPSLREPRPKGEPG